MNDKDIKNNLFKCEGLPDFEQFTPVSIEHEFPKIIQKLNSDFEKRYKFFIKLIIKF